MSLRDLEEDLVIEATCLRCQYTWQQSPLQLLIKVDHRDVHLDEVERNLTCPRRECRNVCQIASNRDPYFAPKSDPFVCDGSAGHGGTRARSVASWA